MNRNVKILVNLLKKCKNNRIKKFISKGPLNIFVTEMSTTKKNWTKINANKKHGNHYLYFLC